MVLTIGSNAEACRQALSPLFELIGLEPLPLSPGTAELSQPEPGSPPQAPAATGATPTPTNPLAQLLAPLGLLTTGGAR